MQASGGKFSVFPWPGVVSSLIILGLELSYSTNADGVLLVSFGSKKAWDVDWSSFEQARSSQEEETALPSSTTAMTAAAATATT